MRLAVSEIVAVEVKLGQPWRRGRSLAGHPPPLSIEEEQVPCALSLVLQIEGVIFTFLRRASKVSLSKVCVSTIDVRRS